MGWARNPFTFGVVALLAAACVALLPSGSSVGAARRVPSCDGHRGTITGTGDLRGTSHRDVIVATGSHSQVIRAGGGDDLVCAGPGSDHVYGGRGDDTLSDGVGHDHLDGGLGVDSADGGGSTDTCISIEDPQSCELRVL